MSNQYPKSFDSVRGAVLAFMRSCDPHIEKLRDRQLLKEEISRLQGTGGALGTGMKNTGMSRMMDGLGRVVIPRELRRTIGLDKGSAVEIFFDEEARTIYLQSYNMEKCAICNSTEDLSPINMGFAQTEKHVCEECISRIFEGDRPHHG